VDEALGTARAQVPRPYTPAITAGSYGDFPLPKQPPRCTLPRGSRGCLRGGPAVGNEPASTGALPTARRNLLARTPGSGDGFTVHDLTIS